MNVPTPTPSTLVPETTGLRALAWAPRRQDIDLNVFDVEIEYHHTRSNKAGNWVTLKHRQWTVEIAYRPKSLYHWLGRLQYTDYEGTLNTVHRYGVSLPIVVAGVLAAARNVPDRMPEVCGAFVEAYYLRRGAIK